MTQHLKLSTASQVVHLGPFFTTAGAPATGLTIANTDIKLLKKGGTSFVNKNSGGATEISQGLYHCTMDATDSNTLGDMEAHVNVTGAMPLAERLRVASANEWDALHGGTKWLSVTADEPKVSIAAGVATVKATDGTTTQFTKTMSTDAAALPIISST